MARFVPIVIQVQGAGQGEAAVNQMTDAFRQLDDSSEKASKGGMRNAFIAAEIFTTAAREMFQLIKSGIVDTTLYAARTETLGIALHQLAKANQLSTVEVDAHEKSLRKLGISQQEARQVLTQMISANLDVAKASKLAVVAQDLAVVSGKNSSETFQLLQQGIQTMQIDVLRSAGAFISIDKVLDNLAETTGRARDSFSETEKQQGVLNAVIEYGTRVTGTYDAAMGTAGKQMGSMARLADDAKQSVGELFQGPFSLAITILSELLIIIAAYPAAFTGATVAVTVFAASLALMNTQLIPATIVKMGGLIASVQLLGKVMVGTAGLIQGAAATTLVATAGWAALVIAVGAVTYGLYRYATAQQEANGADERRLTTITNLIKVNQDDVIWLNTAGTAIENNRENRIRYEQALARLEPVERARISALTEEKERVDALSASLKEQIVLREKERDIQLAAAVAAATAAAEEEAQRRELVNAQITYRNELQELANQGVKEIEKYTGGTISLAEAIKLADARIVGMGAAAETANPEFQRQVNLLADMAKEWKLTGEEMVQYITHAKVLTPEQQRLADRINETNSKINEQAAAIANVKKELQGLLAVDTEKLDAAVLDIVKATTSEAQARAEARRRLREDPELRRVIEEGRGNRARADAVRNILNPPVRSGGASRGGGDGVERRRREILQDIEGLQEFFRSTFNRALPFRFGQTPLHTRLGYDHKAAADVQLDPRTREGQAVVAYLREQGIPFRASTGREVSGRTGKLISTGPHIHVGELSKALGRQEGAISDAQLSEIVRIAEEDLMRRLLARLGVYLPSSEVKGEYFKNLLRQGGSFTDALTGETFKGAQQQPIPVTEPQLSGLDPVRRQTVDEQYRAAQEERLDYANRLKEAALRLRNIQAEAFDEYRNNTIELTHLEADLTKLRIQNADDQMSAQRRLLLAKSEEVGLERRIQQTKDEIATGPYNQHLRIQLALLEGIADIRRRDEDAIKAQNRAQLELADATVYHAARADAAVMEFLASQRSVTEVIADAKIGVIQSTFDLIDRGLDRATSKLGIVGSLVKELLSGFIRLALTPFFQAMFGGTKTQGPTLFGGGGNGGGGGRGGGGITGFLGNLFGSIFKPQGATAGFSGLTGGFAGGSGGAQFLGGGNINPFASPGVREMLGGGGITPPESLSSASASQGAIGQVIAEAARAQTSGGGGGGFGGLFSGLAEAGPLLGLTLGAGLGASLGGPSRLGQALGLIGGGAIGVVAGSALPAILAGSFAGLTALGFATLGIGGALLIAALIIGKNSARRRDEQTRNQAMLDSLAQLDQIISAVKSDRLDGSSALAAAAQVRQQYVQSMSALKDSKTRGIALKDVYRLDLKIDQIKQAAEAQTRRQHVTSRLTPAFNTGLDAGLVPYRGGLQTLIKVRPGERIDDVGLMESFRVPGVDRGHDSVLTVATPGSRVLTRSQQARIPGFASGTREDASSFKLPPVVIEEVSVDIDAEGIVRVGMKARGNREVMIKNVRSGFKRRAL